MNKTDAQVSQQTSTPDSALKRLNMFVGKWNTEGQIKESSFGPAAKLIGMDTYEWLAGGFFLIHHVNVRMGDQKNEAIEMIGYDASSNTYPMHSYNSQGNTTAMKANVADNIWTF